MEHAEIYLRVKSGAGREKGEGETASSISLFFFCVLDHSSCPLYNDSHATTLK